MTNLRVLLLSGHVLALKLVNLYSFKEYKFTNFNANTCIYIYIFIMTVFFPCLYIASVP